VDVGLVEGSFPAQALPREYIMDPQLEALGFPQRERWVDLELVETCTFSSRVVYLRYRVARNI
jgi:hypothetical protein